jgi:fatty-acid peroxygenase
MFRFHSPIGLLTQGYDYISNECERRGTDVFSTRLLAKPVVCMRGAEATEVFYDPDRFRRAGVAPRRVEATLVGRGGVQGLDGDAHRERKQMFMSLMTPEALSGLDAIFARRLAEAIDGWEDFGGEVVVYDEMARVLCATVCEWAGVPLGDDDVAVRASQLTAMVEATAAVGPRHWRGRRARARAERWLADVVVRTRRGDLAPPPGSALSVVAHHRDVDDRLLTPRVAAVELLNVLRPTVAVDRYIVFIACALHENRGWAERLRSGADDDEVERFVHEVRRHYPFFPLQAAEVRSAFDWGGVRFPEGALVLMDLYGTNHHPDLWADPDRFDPDRFAGWDGSPFSLIPQGGGDHMAGHRCAGEWATIGLMKVATRALTRQVDYDVPLQDLRMSRRKMPALPNSGFAIGPVRRVPALVG